MEERRTASQATEPIHSNTLSKHTQASRLPQTQPARGHRAEAGPHTRHLPALPHHPNTEGKENNREGKWPVWGLIERNVKPFVGQASPVLLEFLNIKEKNNLCETSSPGPPLESLTVFYTPSASTGLSHVLSERAELPSYRTKFSHLCVYGRLPPSLSPSHPLFFLSLSLPSLLPFLLPFLLSSFFLITEEAKLHFFSVTLFHHLPLTQSHINILLQNLTLTIMKNTFFFPLQISIVKTTKIRRD